VPSIATFCDYSLGQSVEALPVNDQERCRRELFALTFRRHTDALSSVLRQLKDPSHTNTMSMFSSHMGTCVAIFVASILTCNRI
jgi:hypothetical protein